MTGNEVNGRIKKEINNRFMWMMTRQFQQIIKKEILIKMYDKWKLLKYFRFTKNRVKVTIQFSFGNKI